MNLPGKVVWITGASSGIGEAIAYALAKKGCQLILSSRNTNQLNKVKEQTQLADDKVMVLPIDLENYRDASEWVKKVMNKFNRIDVLVNCAGLSQESLALETSPEVENKLMNINYFGNVALAKAVAPVMKQQKSGRIAVITSILGKFGLPRLSTYAATKHALYGFYDSFRLELVDDNVSVLLVSPGFINTNVALHAVTGDGSLYNKNSPAQENGMKTEVFAQKFITALQSSRKHKYIGKKELLSIPFKTFFPNLFYHIMYKMSKNKK